MLARGGLERRRVRHARPRPHLRDAVAARRRDRAGASCASSCYISDMQHVRLGRTGLQVSRICLGTMTFGLQVDEPSSRADPRSRGRARRHLPRHRRRVPARRRPHDRRPHRGDRRPVDDRASASSYVVATKCFAPMGRESLGHGEQPPAHHGRDRRVAAAAADRLHRPLPTALRRPAACRSTRRSARSTISCAPARCATSAARTSSRTGCARAIGRSEALGLARFDSVQPRYNLLFREFERELFPLCLDEGIGVIPYNPIAGGMLSGKHDRTKPPDEGTRFTLGNAAQHLPGPLLARQRVRHRRRAREDRERRGHAACRRSRSRGCCSIPAITAPIVGASRPDQLDATIAARRRHARPGLARPPRTKSRRRTAAATRPAEHNRSEQGRLDRSAVPLRHHAYQSSRAPR